MDEEEKRMEKLNRSLQRFFSKQGETRCQSYTFAREALEQGIQLKDVFTAVLGVCITQETQLHLAGLLNFVNIFVISHKEMLANDYNCYPVFKSLLMKYQECIESRSLSRVLDITMENVINTFPRNFTLIMTLRFFGEQSLPMHQSLIENGLYIAQAVAQVTGEDVPLISSFLPFAVLRNACANIMDIRVTSNFQTEYYVCQWTEDLLTALWYMNRLEMMTVFKSLTGAFRERAVSLITNYGMSKHRAFVLESESPRNALRAEIIEQEEENMQACFIYECGDSTENISTNIQEFEQLESLQKADLPPISVPGTSSADPITVESDDISDDEEVEDILPTQIFYASKRDIPPISVASSIDLFKEIMGKNTTEEELQVGLDHSKSETCMFNGSKVAARQSILNLLSNPRKFTASKEDLLQLVSDVNKKSNDQKMLYENKPGQGEIQESAELMTPDYNVQLNDSNSERLERIPEEEQGDFSQAVDLCPSDIIRGLCNDDFDGTGASLKTLEIKEEILNLGERVMLDNFNVPHSNNTIMIADLHSELGNENRQDLLSFKHTTTSCPNIFQIQEGIAKEKIKCDDVPDEAKVLEDPQISGSKKSAKLSRLSDEKSTHNLEHSTQSLPNMSNIQVGITEVPQEELKCGKGGDGTEVLDDLHILHSKMSIMSEPGLSVEENAFNLLNTTQPSPKSSQIQELTAEECQLEIKCDEVPDITEVLEDPHNLEHTTQSIPNMSNTQVGIAEVPQEEFKCDTGGNGTEVSDDIHISQSGKSVMSEPGLSVGENAFNLLNTTQSSLNLSHIEEVIAEECQDKIKCEEVHDGKEVLKDPGISESKMSIKLSGLSIEESTHNLKHTTQPITNMSTIQEEIYEIRREEFKCDKGIGEKEVLDDVHVLKSEKSIMMSESRVSVGEIACDLLKTTQSSPKRSKIQELIVKECKKEMKCNEVPDRTEVLDFLHTLQSKKSIMLSDPGSSYRESTHNLEHITQLSPKNSDSQEGIVEGVESCKGLVDLHVSQTKKSIVVSETCSNRVITHTSEGLEHTPELSADTSQIQEEIAKEIKCDEETKALDNVDVYQSKVSIFLSKSVSDDEENIEQTSQAVSPTEIQVVTVEEVGYDSKQFEDSRIDNLKWCFDWKPEPGLEMQDEEPGDGFNKMKTKVSKTHKDTENIPILEVKKETYEEYETEIKASFLSDDLKATKEDSAQPDVSGAVRFTSTAKLLTGLPVASAQREELVECGPPIPVATPSGTSKSSYQTASASVSKFKSIVSIPSKIISLFRAKRFKSQTTICEENEEQTVVYKEIEEEPFSIESNTQMCAEELKMLKLQIESLNNEIDGCTVELNETVLEIEQLRKKVLCQNMIIRNRKRKTREKREKYRVNFL